MPHTNIQYTTHPTAHRSTQQKERKERYKRESMCDLGCRIISWTPHHPVSQSSLPPVPPTLLCTHSPTPSSRVMMICEFHFHLNQNRPRVSSGLESQPYNPNLGGRPRTFSFFPASLREYSIPDIEQVCQCQGYRSEPLSGYSSFRCNTTISTPSRSDSILHGF
jgi:hypothetical protein